MDLAEAKEKLRRRIASDQADLAALERAEATLARLDSEASTTNAPYGPQEVKRDHQANGAVPPFGHSGESADGQSLTDAVTEILAAVPPSARFSKNDLIEAIQRLKPGIEFNFTSVSSVLWSMAERGQLHIVRRGTGKRASLYSKTPSRDVSSGVEVFEDQAENSEELPA